MHVKILNYNKRIHLILYGIIIGISSGVISFLFLKSLKLAISFRVNHPLMILGLPFAGAFVAWVYHKIGRDIEGGNNLIIDEIHSPTKHIPFKMVPMIFIASTISHLFGASVGREGAAVQMGAGLSDILSRFFHEHRKYFLMMGISAGFASIFGAPIAGTIFGMEVLSLNLLQTEAFFPCLIAAVAGYFTAIVFGLHQTPIAIIEISSINILGLTSALVAGVFFGLAARLFSWSIHFVKNIFTVKIKNPILRPFLGGLLVVACFYLFGNDRYLNLGEEVIHSSFTEHVYPWDFLGKIWMTAVSVGSGFKGGEVMPLFYVGATLGNCLSYLLWLPYPMLAALGFVSVFSGAANTPVTGIVLAMEFFGSEISIYAALAVVTSYLFSGSLGIYSSQRGNK
jgi:H+/Cl- antiporter ClcA